MRNVTAFIFLVFFLSGCSLPSAGPSTISTSSEKQDSAPYEIIDVKVDALKAIALYEAPHFTSEFTSKLPPPPRVVSIGDQLSVTIWEAAAGGLFSDVVPGTATGSRATAIPVQTVGSDGKIKIPYAGEIPVTGLLPSDISQTIEQKLKGKAIKPQVLVSIVSNGSFWASVSGDVTGAARVPLTPKGDRILDIISQAGGVKAMPFETYVRLTRGPTTETVLLDTILKKPAENVYIYPGDQIYVYRQPTSYVALGAVTAQKDYAIDKEKLSLSQAVARAGGMIDAQADPASLYLFRYESPAVVKAINPASAFLSGNEPVPVIYRINFSKPENFFLAQEFEIRDKDIIYVADSSTVQFNKFLGILRSVASIYGSLRINSLILN